MSCGNTKQQLQRVGLTINSNCPAQYTNSSGQLVHCHCPFSDHRDEPVVTVPNQSPNRAVQNIFQNVQSYNQETYQTKLTENQVLFIGKNLLIRKRWIELYDEIVKGKESKLIWIRGKSGRGKTAFIYYMIFRLLLEAKFSHEHRNPQICFVDRSEKIHFITKDICHVVPATPNSTDIDFYIDDSLADLADEEYAKFRTIAVSSDCETKSEYGKRTSEVNASIFWMPSPTVEEMKLITRETLSLQEVEFRLDIVGCNPRMILNEGMSRVTTPASNKYVNCIETCINSFSSCEWTTDQQEWITNTVMFFIDRSLDLQQPKKLTANSLFRDFYVSDNFRTAVDMPSTAFMCELEGEILKQFKSESTTLLHAIFGQSGIGNCHEYDSHHYLLDLKPGDTQYCFSYLDDKWVAMPLGGPVVKKSPANRTVAYIRSISDIKKALVTVKNKNGYIQPTISNFPLIDGIVPPNITVQMTISSKHTGAIDKAIDIATVMGFASTDKKLPMVFIVPESAVSVFKFPTEMPDFVDMYVTTPRPMRLTEAKSLRSGMPSPPSTGRKTGRQTEKMSAVDQRSSKRQRRSTTSNP